MTLQSDGTHLVVNDVRVSKASLVRADKVRFDYTTIGLVKKDGIVTFDGKGINDIANCKDYLANYGLFVIMTRSLAGHEKDTDAEKKAILVDTFSWFTEGMPKRAKAGRVNVKQATINLLKEQIKSASKVEAKILQSIVEKLELELEKEIA